MKHKSLKLQAVFFLFALCPMPYALSQQYGWTNISHKIPDYLHDTTVINNGADTLIASLTDICFISENEGWITASHTFDQENGSILHTSDGGETWEVQTVLRPCNFIHFVDENVGYAGATGGMILKTSDGGDNWVLHGATATNISGMSFPPGSDTGYVCSYSASKMHQITPEGVNTIGFDNAPFWWQSISAPSHELIWLSNGTSVYSFDQDGLADQPVTSDNYYSLFFLRINLGWGCGSHGVKDRNPGTIMGCVGKNIPWVVLSYTDGPLYDVFALDEDHVWAVGVDGQVFYTENASDFGFDTQTSTGWSNVEFIKQPIPRPEAFFRSVFFTSVNNGFVAGNENVLLKYGMVSGVEEYGGMEAWRQWGVEVYPNPTFGKFQITTKSQRSHQLQSRWLSGQVSKIEIVDLFGKTVAIFNAKSITHNLQPATCNLQLDIGHLPGGVYFVRIALENQTMVKKILKL